MNKKNHENRYCVICKRPFTCKLQSKQQTCRRQCSVKYNRTSQSEYHKRPEVIAKYKAYISKPEVIDRRKVYQIEYEKRPEIIAMRKAHAKNPEAIAKRKTYLKRPEVIVRNKARQAEYHKRPEVIAKYKVYRDKYRKRKKQVKDE